LGVDELSGLMKLVAISGSSKIRLMDGVAGLLLSAEFDDDSELGYETF